MAATIIESENVVLVDTAEGIKSIDAVAGGGSCNNGPSSSCSAVFDYIDISKKNKKTFKSYAKADNNGKRISPGSIKIYCRSLGEFPNLTLNDLTSIQSALQSMYPSKAGGIEPAPLSSRLAQEIAGRIGFYYNSSDIKLRVEQGAATEMDTSVWNDKSFSPIMEKFINLRFPIKEYYIQNKKESYEPTFNATISPGITSFNDINNKYNIKITLTDGEVLQYCKSALVSVNRDHSFGMRYNDLTSTSILPNTPYANWGDNVENLMNDNSLSIANQIYNQLIDPGIVSSIIEAQNPGQAYVRIQRSSDKYNLYNGTMVYNLGGSFSDNWEALLPDSIIISPPEPNAILHVVNQYAELQEARARANQQAAEAIRQANRNTLGTPSVTSTTNLQLNTKDPVLTPKPVNPDITAGTANGQGTGTNPNGGGAIVDGL